MQYSFSSSEAALVANGRAIDVLTPWTLTIDTDQQTITVSKRNRILVGVDEDILSFRFIRRVIIDEHLIGADITIQAVGGKLSAYCLEKEDCKRIKTILLEYNSNTSGHAIIFG